MTFDKEELQAIYEAMEKFQSGVYALERVGLGVELQADLYTLQGKFGAILNVEEGEEHWVLDMEG